MTPEWEFSFQSQFDFTYDKAVFDVEKDFLRGKQNKFQNQSLRFVARPFFQGKAKCDPSVLPNCGLDLPANPPTLRPQLVIHANAARTWEIIQDLKPKYWPTERAEVEKILQKSWPKYIDLKRNLVTYEGAEDGTIGLKPGQRTNFKVSLGIYPVYEEVNNWGINPPGIKKWNLDVNSIVISQAKVDYTQRSKSIVSFSILLDSNRKRLFNKYVYTWLQLVTDVGAWVGLLAIGGTLLGVMQSIFTPFGLVNEWDVDEFRQKWRQKIEDKLLQHNPNKPQVIPQSSEEVNVALEDLYAKLQLASEATPTNNTDPQRL